MNGQSIGQFCLPFAQPLTNRFLCANGKNEQREIKACFYRSLKAHKFFFLFQPMCLFGQCELIRVCVISASYFACFFFIVNVGEERRFQEPVSSAPTTVNVSPSYLDQRRSQGSVTVQMEEKYQPPSATSLYESRFQRRPPVSSCSF